MLSFARFSIAVLLLTMLSAAHAVEPLATRQTAFGIPYRVEPPRTPAEKPVEVQLYVSADQGAAWKLHSRVPPEQGKFAFKAEKDGEYWFLVRTKDSAGHILPQKPAAPELQVLVDTTQPALELVAARGEAGELTIRWRASDAHLQPQNLKLDYQTAGAADLWQSIAIDPRRTQVAAGICQGEVTLWLRTTSEKVIVRGEVTDRAGNLAVTQSVIEAMQSSAAGNATAPAAAGAAITYPDTGAAAPTQPAAEAWRAARPTAQQPAIAATRPLAAPTVSGLFPALGLRWPVDHQARTPLARSAADPAPVTPLVVQRLPAGAAADVASTSTQTTPAPSATAASDWVQPPLTDIQRPAPRRMTNVVAAVSNVSAVAAAGYRPPPGTQPRMISALSFQLDYVAGPPGSIRKVELWGTRDGGQHWHSYGADSDMQSPMTVTVEGEGMYGFRILVESTTGTLEFPPQHGDRPDTWVGVDLTRPRCRLMPMPPRAEGADQLQIDWEAHDEWLAERPISLSYSQQPAGPWLPIATGLENTGRYAWPLDNRLPEQVYLRLEARDQAGNVEVYQSPEPLMISRPAPPSRIRDVRPSHHTGQAPQRYRFW